MNRVVLALLSGMVLSMSLAFAAPIQGAGARSCEEFNLDIAAQKIANVEDIYANWALGYISTKNMQREAQGLSAVDLSPGNFDFPAQRSFLRTFCAGNPRKLYFEAAFALWRHILTLNQVGV